MLSLACRQIIKARVIVGAVAKRHLPERTESRQTSLHAQITTIPNGTVLPTRMSGVDALPPTTVRSQSPALGTRLSLYAQSTSGSHPVSGTLFVLTHSAQVSLILLVL